MPSGACEPPWPPFWPPGMSLLQSVLQCCCLSAVPWRDCSCCGCAVVRRWTVRTALHQRPGVPEPQQLPGAGRQRSSGRDAVPDRYFLGTFSMRCLSCVDFLIWGRDSHSLHLSRAQFWQHVAWGRRGILRKKNLCRVALLRALACNRGKPGATACRSSSHSQRHCAQG